MTISPSLLRRYRFFRDERKITASYALALARAEQWQEDNEDVVRVCWENDQDPDFSYLDPSSSDTPREKATIARLKKEMLEQYNRGDLTVEGCIIERLSVVPACAHCKRDEERHWGQIVSLWGIHLIGDDSYRREVAAELLLEAMPEGG